MLLRSARKLGSHSALLLAVAWLGACSTAGPPAPRSPASSETVSGDHSPGTVGERAAQVAVGQLGAPYRYGGMSSSGFDCSGLVHYSYAKAGKSIPRTTAGLWRGIPPVAGGELQTGDILFFDIEGKMSHVGLYIGDGRFVHAPASGRTVSIESLKSDFYSQAFVRGGRP